ncbi:MAG: hypothetical protein R3D89_00765 [Sphingomonadaceae bacterium]
MQIEDWLRRHPPARRTDRKAADRLRTAAPATLMVNLLASDPASRCFMRWEGLDPMPPATADEIHARPSDDGEGAREMAKQHMAHIAAIHWEGPTARPSASS